MMLTLLKTEFQKMKKRIWFLVILVPVVAVMLQVVNYTVRYDYLISREPDQWHFLVVNVHSFWPPLLILEITLLVSLIASLEHQTMMWRKLISLPVRTNYLYYSKLIVICLLTLLSSMILVGGTYGLGWYLGFGSDIPHRDIWSMVFYTLLAALPFIFIQFWFSVKYVNQGVALTVGIASAVFMMYAHDLPNWLPWKWPLLVEGFVNGIDYALYGLAFGVLGWIISTALLTRREMD